MGEETTTTEILDNNQPDTTEVDVKSAEKSPSIEDVAREQGWRPKEEYDGDPTKWVSAETFVAKGELIDRIEALGKELKQAKKANQMLLDHHNKVKAVEFERALEHLKNQKKTAYENNDVDAIVEIDEKIASVKETRKAQEAQDAAQTTDTQEFHPEFIEWKTGNKWYDKDADLKEEADIMGLTYARKHPDAPPKEVLSYVAKQIKRLYPEKFSNPARSQPNAVESGGPANSGSRKDDNFAMTEEERRVMMTFVHSGVMTKEQYIADLKTIKGVK